MASDDNEHRMLFDLRGRRRNVIKVVYAVLAILMGASLFLTVGPFSIAEIFNDGSGTGNASEPYEEQAERLEAKLRKDPQNPDLLMALTRAKVNLGNTQVTVDSSGERSFSTEAVQGWEEAYQSWSEYLEAADKPAPGLAMLMAPTILQLAELSRSYPQAVSRIQAASDAQEIVAKQRPSVNSYSTLALYTYFTGDFAAAERAKAEAEKLAGGKAERKAIDDQLAEVRKRAKSFIKDKEKVERQEKAARAAGGENPSIESPENPLGGALGGGLTE